MTLRKAIFTFFAVMNLLGLLVGIVLAYAAVKAGILGAFAVAVAILVPCTIGLASAISRLQDMRR